MTINKTLLSFITQLLIFSAFLLNKTESIK